jgi:hypothetical protein
MDWASLGLKDWIAIAGFVLAVALAVLRLFEYFRDRRPRLRIVVNLTSSAEIGNDIVLLNASKVPAGIWAMDLVWVKAGFFGKRHSLFRKVINNEYSPDDYCNITVGAHSQHTLSFSEQNHFAWGDHASGDLYLRLWLIGSLRPKWFFVTGQ